MNNKKLFKGALVLFASILMAVSCQSNSNPNDNSDSNSNNNNNNTEKPTPVSQTTDNALAILQAIGEATKGKIEGALVDDDSGSKKVIFDLTTLKKANIIKNDNNTFTVTGVAGGTTDTLTKANTVKVSVLTKDAASIKHADTAIKDVNASVTANEITVTYVSDTEATLTIPFTDTKDSANIKASIIIPLTLTEKIGARTAQTVKFSKE